ncbi:MAG: hypothetical protein NVS1B7_5250 [Candidatus Saccharimonadales bacterium]
MILPDSIYKPWFEGHPSDADSFPKPQLRNVAAAVLAFVDNSREGDLYRTEVHDMSTTDVHQRNNDLNACQVAGE